MRPVLDTTGLVAEIRRFNRFYTRKIGLLEETLANSSYTLAEARVLFELGHRVNPAPSKIAGMKGYLQDALHLNVGPVSSEVAEALRLDPAYLTRILRKFGTAGLIEMHADPSDGRRRLLSLTAKGKAALTSLQAAQDAGIARLIEHLDDAQASRLGHALRLTKDLLDSTQEEAGDVSLRPHRIGDVGWVIERQSRMYAEEYGWNDEYEALVCEIGSAFLKNFVQGKEFCWIAERDGERLGAVFLVRRSEEEAQLRMLHVERAARGAGVGKMLVDECIRTARAVGYTRMMLWTNDVLDGARRLYERAGFQLASQEGHRSFGHDLHGQIWELKL